MLTATLHRIEATDPALARLLHGTVRTGAVCRYDPDPGRPVRWRLTPAPASSGGTGDTAGLGWPPG